MTPRFTWVATKVIIHKSRGEVSLVEQDTIKNDSAAYLKFIIIFFGNNFFFFTFILCNFLVWMLQYCFLNLKKKLAYKNMKKTASKVAHNRPIFFSVQWNLDLRKILGVTKIFLKSRFFLISSTRKPLKKHNFAKWTSKTTQINILLL